jgi:hypothetical protein
MYNRKFLIFRALNTFIDDLFAFIIRMPTMHRLSCFRDDIVFFIYIYQRWCYPVDTNRPAIGVEKSETEGGGDDEASGPVVGPFHMYNLGEVQEAAAAAADDDDDEEEQEKKEAKEPSSVPIALNADNLFLEGIRLYTLYWKRRRKTKDNGNKNKQLLVEAEEKFSKCSTLAASSALLPSKESSKWLLLHGRALTCCMSVSECLGALVKSLEYGLRAKNIFLSLSGVDHRSSTTYLYQCLNNMSVIILELYLQCATPKDTGGKDNTKKDHYLGVSREHTQHMIDLLTNGDGTFYKSLGLNKGSTLKKHQDRLAALCLVEKGAMTIVIAKDEKNNATVNFVPVVGGKQ